MRFVKNGFYFLKIVMYIKTTFKLVCLLPRKFCGGVPLGEYDKTLFKISEFRIGNGGYIFTKVKGIIVISTSTGTKTISNVFYVPDINKNLLSVGELIEKEFKVFFEHQHCLIYDIASREALRVKMRCKSFSFDPTKEEHETYYTKVNLT